MAKLKDNLGKIGVGIMVVGLARLFYDSYEINQQFPTNYRWYDNPDPIVPIVSMLISLLG